MLNCGSACAVCTTVLSAGRMTWSITCTTPLPACTSVAVMVALRLRPSVMTRPAPTLSTLKMPPCAVVTGWPSGTCGLLHPRRQHVVGQHGGQQRLVGQQRVLADAELGQQRCKGGVGGRKHRQRTGPGQGVAQAGGLHGLDQHAEVGQGLRGLHQAAVGRQQHLVELVDHAVGRREVGGRDARRAVAAVGDDQLGTRRVDLEDAAGQRADGLADRHRAARHPAAEHVVLQHRGQQGLVGQAAGPGSD
jgi:hypothetical protein